MERSCDADGNMSSDNRPAHFSSSEIGLVAHMITVPCTRVGLVRLSLQALRKGNDCWVVP